MTAMKATTLPRHTDMCPVDHSLYRWATLTSHDQIALQSCSHSRRAITFKIRNKFRIVSLNKDTDKPEYKLADGTLEEMMEKLKKLDSMDTTPEDGFKIAKEGCKKIQEMEVQETLHRPLAIAREYAYSIYIGVLLGIALISRYSRVEFFVVIVGLLCIGSYLSVKRQEYLVELEKRVINFFQ